MGRPCSGRAACKQVGAGSHPPTRACGAGRARCHSHARRCPSTPMQPFPGLSVQQFSPHQPRKEVAPPTGGGLPCVAVASHTYATADSFTRGWVCSHTCDHPLRERVSELIFYSSASWKVVANPPQWLKSHCNTGENTGRGCPLAGHTPAPVRAHHRLHAADDGASHPADWRETETARWTGRGAVHWALYTAAWDRRVAGARVLRRGARGATRSRMGSPHCGPVKGKRGVRALARERVGGGARKMLSLCAGGWGAEDADKRARATGADPLWRPPWGP